MASAGLFGRKSAPPKRMRQFEAGSAPIREPIGAVGPGAVPVRPRIEPGTTPTDVPSRSRCRAAPPPGRTASSGRGAGTASIAF